MTKKILKFEADWCGPCKMMTKTLDDPAFSDIEIIRIDIDNSENSELVTEYGIRSIPTLVFFKDEELIERLVGAISKEKILSVFED